MRKEMFVIPILVLALTAVSGEQTMGLFLNEADSYKGYTLFSPISSRTTYLINNEGMLVNSWNSEYTPAMMAYLSEGGYLYRLISLDSVNSRLRYNYAGVEKMDWEGKVLWHYEYGSDDYVCHHDIATLPNGNVLLIACEAKDSIECIQAGRDSRTLNGEPLLVDYLIEIRPVGDSGADVVWEWHLWNHLITEVDSTNDNYGDVEEHPDHIDINYQGYRSGTNDWTHFNSVAYNEEFDQIMVSSFSFGEIWVIDHSTTTSQARGHTGGRYGKGGDILYRWGNPQTYDAGGLKDEKLYQQHDAQWIPQGIPGAGNILVFNNGSPRGYSSVDEIVPPVDAEGNYHLEGSRFGPQEPMWSYTAPNPPDLFAPVFSGEQRLPNGNTLICDGPRGDFIEVTPEGNMVWRYVNPVNQYGPATQGDSVPNNLVFKVRRYAPDYPGLEDRDLNPKGPIEKYSDVVEDEPDNRVELKVYPAPSISTANVAYHLSMSGHVSLNMYNITGQKVRTLVNEVKPAGYYQIAWDGTDDLGHRLSSGVYFIKLEAGKETLKERIVLIR